MMLIEIADKNLSKMKKQVLLNTSQHSLTDCPTRRRRCIVRYGQGSEL